MFAAIVQHPRLGRIHNCLSNHLSGRYRVAIQHFVGTWGYRLHLVGANRLANYSRARQPIDDGQFRCQHWKPGNFGNGQQRMRKFSSHDIYPKQRVGESQHCSSQCRLPEFSSYLQQPANRRNLPMELCLWQPSHKHFCNSIGCLEPGGHLQRYIDPNLERMFGHRHGSGNRDQLRLSIWQPNL